MADGLLHLLESEREPELALGVFAALAPVSPWVTYFVVLRVIHDAAWPLDLWLGTVGLTSMSGLALSFVAPPAELQPGRR